MTQTLDQMVTDLTRDILDMASVAPIPVTTISAKLPIEFGLRMASGAHLVATPPENLQARVLTTPIGHMHLTLEIGRVDHV
jgi:hypothetical protein